MGPGMWGSPHLHSPPMPIIFSGQWTSSFASRTEILKLEYQNFPWGGKGLLMQVPRHPPPEVLIQSIRGGT